MANLQIVYKLKKFFFLIYYLSFKTYVKTKLVSPNEHCVPFPKKSKPKKGLSFLFTELYHLTGKCVLKKHNVRTIHVLYMYVLTFILKRQAIVHLNLKIDF